MSVLRYRCPKSNAEVATTIDTRRDVLIRMRAMNLTIWAWCPHCLTGHQVKPTEAKLDDEVVTTVAPVLRAS
jgi:hypothetical protein